MTDTTKPDPRPVFTPSTQPHPADPGPLVAFIEKALLTIANRQEKEAPIPEEEAPIPEEEAPMAAPAV